MNSPNQYVAHPEGLRDAITVLDRLSSSLPSCQSPSIPPSWPVPLLSPFSNMASARMVAWIGASSPWRFTSRLAER